jgi:hypothetical protein
MFITKPHQRPYSSSSISTNSLSGSLCMQSPKTFHIDYPVYCVQHRNICSLDVIFEVLQERASPVITFVHSESS